MGIYDMFNNSDQQARLRQVQNDPVGIGRQAGFQIPEDLAGNPQAMVMHLIQSGQVSNPMLQRIMPMIQKLSGK